MPYHLPVLLNPLLNAVLNCPSPKTSSLKQIFSRLNNKKFFLLVPSTEYLLQYADLESGLGLAELCYHYDFVASHIVVVEMSETDATGQRTLYNGNFTTLNGKKLSIKYQSGIITTGDGFATRRKVAIVETNSIPTFNDYLTGSHTTPVLYINSPLCGDFVLTDDLQVFSTVAGMKHPTIETSPLTYDETGKRASRFEQKIQSSKDTSERLALTFHLTRARIKKAALVKEVKNEWMNCRDSVRQIILTDKHLSRTEDLDSMIYDYVELKLFSSIHQQLTELNLEKELEQKYEFRLLKNISLNQIPTNFYKSSDSFSVARIVELEKSLNSAIECFKTMNSKNTHEGKLEVLSNTMKLISREISDVAIDADTLLSLFVILICRSQVTGLITTLSYLSNFALSEASIKFGLQGYVLSTFEAALSYFREDTVHSLTNKCLQNKNIWATIKQGKQVSNDIIEPNLSIRTDNCESLLSICIQSHNTEFLIILLTQFEEAFPLEDILDDRDFEGCSLLVQALQYHNLDASDIIISIILGSCQEPEIVKFLNSSDLHNRIVAHYIMQDISLLDTVGKYLDWEHKDINGHTPLFSVLRGYDAPNYKELVAKVLDAVTKWYNSAGKPFDFLVHEDPKGNTLLHVMKSDIELLLKLPGVDVNKPDKKGLSPLMSYVKYNRVDNIETIMGDERLVWDTLQQPLVMTALDFTRNPKVAERILKHTLVDTCVFLHSLRFEDRKWKIGIFCSESSGKYSLELIQQYLKFLEVKFPTSFQPIEILKNELKLMGLYGVPSLLRFQSYHTIRKLNLLFDHFYSKYNFWFGKEEEQLRTVLDVPDSALSESERFVRLEPEEINGMQGFLKYNLTEFQALDGCLIILKKLAIVQLIKSRDVATSQNLFSRLGSLVSELGISTPFNGLNFTWCYDLSHHRFIRNLEYLQQTLLTLLSKIEAVLEKISLWWRYYGEHMELKKEWKRNFPKEKETKAVSNSKSFFYSYIEGKRSTFRSKLLNQLKMSSLHLKKIGGDIKTSNEGIAVEIGSFLEYKEQFYLRHVVGSVVKHRIKECKHLMQRMIDLRNEHI